MKIGIIGSSGDLGAQIVDAVKKTGLDYLTCDPKDKDSASLYQVFSECDLIHLSVPLDKLVIHSKVAKGKIVILHDSVMSTSQIFNVQMLQGSGSVVHMLMNETNSVVVADETPHANVIDEHFQSLGYTTHHLTIREHDKLMAQSQAPFALLIKALHVPLHEQAERGLLTASGELLMRTLDSRVLEWTPETIHSILKNPMLNELIDDISNAHKNI